MESVDFFLGSHVPIVIGMNPIQVEFEQTWNSSIFFTDGNYGGWVFERLIGLLMNSVDLFILAFCMLSRL